jgi:hypothetical protein
MVAEQKKQGTWSHQKRPFIWVLKCFDQLKHLKLDLFWRCKPPPWFQDSSNPPGNKLSTWLVTWYSSIYIPKKTCQALSNQTWHMKQNLRCLSWSI